jgi:hypothetical protein
MQLSLAASGVPKCPDWGNDRDAMCDETKPIDAMQNLVFTQLAGECAVAERAPATKRSQCFSQPTLAFAHITCRRRRG